MGRESLVAIKVLETARPMRHSTCGHPSGPAAVRPREQAGHTTASNDSRRNEHFPLASRGPSTQDRNDARGLAQIVRTGWYRAVHVKSPACRSWRALLAARRLVLNKLRDVENGVRALLREAGLKVGTPGRKEFAARVRALVGADPVLSASAEPLLAIIEAMSRELARLTKQVLAVVRGEP